MIFLVLSALVGAFLFYDNKIDFYWAQKFFVPGGENLWPHEFDLLWRFFYFAAPFIAFLICLPSLVIFIGSYFKSEWLRWRRRSLFVLISLLLGPGLLINTVFKPNWGRPRPRQVVEFGGIHQYHAFWQKPDSKKGMSFPCGHCSVGFFLVSLAYLIHRKNRLAAASVFTGALAIGFLMGVGRIAAGAHFMSDVFWAGWMTVLATHVSYFYILKLNRPEPVYHLNRRLGLALGAGMVSLSVAGPLLATPFHKSIKRKWQVQQLTIEIDKGDVEVIPVQGSGEVRLEGDIKGFGLPLSEIQEIADGQKFVIQRKGMFTEVEARYKLYLSSDLHEFSLVISKGGAIIGPQVSPHYRFHQEKF